MSLRDIYRRTGPAVQPAHFHASYKSTQRRAPQQPLIALPHTLSELTGISIAPELVASGAADLTRSAVGKPLGERIVVGGRVQDESGEPVRRAVVEIWQCNAAGRYRHPKDNHDAPLDPSFHGAGQAVTDDDGWYRFTTIKPGAYPWRNHHNAWRPSHIHFSLFGPAFLTRLVTQMYFPGDPLLAFDPIFNCVSDQRARERLIAAFDWETTKPDWALGYRFDIVLRGHSATPFEERAHGA
jgi:protocatechuate 3,4-dioxygenase beta subunit